MTVPVEAPPSPQPFDPADELNAEFKTIQGRSLAKIAWNRLRQDKAAMFGLGLIIFFVLIAIFAPLICHIFNVDPDTPNQNLLDDLGMPIGPFSGASWQHPLGIEPQLGRDVLARTVYGARTSLIIALCSTLLAMLIGVTLGIISGYRGSWVDTAVSRTMDVFLAFPTLLFSIAFLVVVGQSPAFQNSLVAQVLFLVFIIGFFGWAYVGRIVRGQTLSLREKEFIEASRSIGARSPRILFREILPNLLPIILVYSTLIIPTNILTEAALSYLGVGLTPPTASWGQSLSNSILYYQIDPFYMLVPGMSIFLCVLAFNLFGDGLRDAFDPRGQR
jgi:ABC-type dipeptide/oligopeptide/nickel transport system permease subunit